MQIVQATTSSWTWKRTTPMASPCASPGAKAFVDGAANRHPARRQGPRLARDGVAPPPHYGRQVLQHLPRVHRRRSRSRANWRSSPTRRRHGAARESRCRSHRQASSTALPMAAPTPSSPHKESVLSAGAIDTELSGVGPKTGTQSVGVRGQVSTRRQTPQAAPRRPRLPRSRRGHLDAADGPRPLTRCAPACTAPLRSRSARRQPPA